MGAEGGAAANVIQNGEVHIEDEVETGESSKSSFESSDHIRTQQISDSTNANQQAGRLLQENFIDATPLASWLREFILTLRSLKSQNHVSVLAAIIFAVIFLMQVCTFQALLRFCYSSDQFNLSSFLQEINTTLI